ncbi:MAG: ATP-binding protein [Hylemonella sp.]|nr:ATP-binding protein [Hylemonella sp.]
MAPFHSLKSRIFATIFLMASLLLGLVYWQLQGTLLSLVEAEVLAHEEIMLDLLRDPSLQALETRDTAGIQLLLEGVSRDQRILRAVLADEHGRVVAASQRKDLDRALRGLKPGVQAHWRQLEIARAKVAVGTLAMEFSRQPLEQAQDDARALAMAIAAGGMILVTVAALATAWLLTRRLDRLRLAAEKMAAGDLAVRTGLDGKDEIAALSRAFDLMARRVAENQYALMRLNVALERRVEERTGELTKSIEDMRRMQDHLLQSEKMAALGSLVAGVSHEINTPLGISVTAATYVEELLKSLEEHIRSGRVTRTALTDFMARTTEANAMVLANLERAAELIRNFKMVAVDQSSAKRREFMLMETLQEIVSTLRPLLKNRRIDLRLDLSDNIAMDSYPGPLGQVITNLFSNALLHAFEGRPKGTIALKVRAYADKSIALFFSDDGVGVPPEHLGRLFDPFFTTKSGEGGSGLGLNIAYNIVTSILGGQITVDSRVGEGTTFTINIPRVAPMAAGAGKPSAYTAQPISPSSRVNADLPPTDVGPSPNAS